jgi:hypothetical protein
LLKFSEDENALHPCMMGARRDSGFKHADIEHENQRISSCRSLSVSLAGHDIRKIIQK